MKKNLLLIIGLISISFFSVDAQVTTYPRCSTTEFMDLLKSQDPSLEQRMEAIEKQTQDWIKSNPTARISQSSTVTIPVVVHVVYNTTAQNISDDMIKSQIDVLNEDYGGYNSDATKTPPFFKNVKAGDTGIRFALATRDPSGNATKGIVRVFTTITQFNMGSSINNASPAWSSSSYLNMWVCNLGSGLLGYAQFPGGSPSTDGVVILYTAFGRVSPYPGGAYAYGRTVTHEVGHWLNLRHIWGDSNCGSDLVNDTPTQQTSNFGCPNCHGFTCNNQPTGDMYMNYMDYSDDRCMYMLTAGQSARINATINGTRVSLQSSLGNNIITSPATDAGITEIVSPDMIPCSNTTVSFIPSVILKNFGTNVLTSATINYKIDSGTPGTFAWSGSLATGTTTNVALPSTTSATGDHIFYCWTSAPNGGLDLDSTNNRTSRNFIGHAANTAFPLSQGFESLPFPPTGWTNRNYDCGTAWARSTTAFHSGVASAYFNNFSATTIQNGVMDELTTQPVDMTTAPANSELIFWKAYAPTSTGIDTLEIFASSDCGVNFTSIYKDWGTTLATAPATNTAFTPTSSQWAQVNVNIGAYAGQKNVIFVFRNRNHGGNNLYIDDLNVTVVGVNEVLSGANLNIYPNPTEGLLNVSTSFSNPESMQITVTDALGQEVYKTVPKTVLSELTTIDLSHASKGIYFVELKTEKGSVVKKVSLSK